MQPIFAVYLAGGENSSEIAFGGVDPRRLGAGERVAWTQVVAPESGYWQVKIDRVRIGNETLGLCEDGSCRAIADTGTSLLGVPRNAAKEVHWKLARPLGHAIEPLDCRQFPGPPIFFDLGGNGTHEGFTIRLDPQDYSRPAPARMRLEDNSTGVFCRSSLLPVDMTAPLGSNVFIWGAPVLQRYYTAYDWGQQRIGFGLPAGAVTA